MSFFRRKHASLPARWSSVFALVPFLIAGSYLIVSALWIVLSDKALSRIAAGYSDYEVLQTYKGWGFVAASALLILFLLKMAWNGILTAYQESLESERHLQLALASAGGGVWELDLTRNEEELAHVSGELVHRLGLPPGHQLTLAELRSRVHPDDAAENNHELGLAISSGGKHPYDIRYRVRCEDGLYRWVRARGNVVASADGRSQRMVGVAFDIDERVKAEQRISQLLRYDPATGLPKQSKFLSDLDDVLNQTTAERWIAVVQLRLLDLDRLIEDAETTEDAALIRAIADRLHAQSGLLVARVAADVFALATPPMPSPAAAQRDAHTAMANLLQPLQMLDDGVELRAQAGGALGRQGIETAIGLLRKSGHALNLASRTTGIAVRWFNEELSVEYSAQTDRIRGLDSAVRHREIECHYQPLVDLRSGRTSGFEVLARWRRKDGTLVPPDQFIALAEEIGKINEIGEEVLRQACATAAAWPAPHPFVAVNVSPLQLEDLTFPGIVARVLNATGLSPARLELEITENALPRDAATARQRIHALRDLGVHVAIDDFGTGYSSLALLSEIPFTRLKIDRSFVSGGGDPHLNTIIIHTIIDLAHNLGLAITAEGVETADQVRMLAAKGVELAQGYYFGRPIATAQLGELVARTWPMPVGIPESHPSLRLVH